MKHKPWSALGLLAVAAGFAWPAWAQSPAPASGTAARPPLLEWLAPGLRHRVLIRAGDPLTDGTRFSPKNDLTAVFPKPDGTTDLLIGHEIRWGADPLGGRFTRLCLRQGDVVAGQLWVSGMHNNCAGGVTPWGTVLSGEEYPHQGLPGNLSNDAKEAAYRTEAIAWDSPAASMGWIYEISPKGMTPAGALHRRTALGRFSHESAQVVGDRVVYLTEDFSPGLFARFTAKRPRDLSEGVLEAYDQAHARWVRVPDLLNANLSARRVGATGFHRLEDVKLGPDGKLYVAETGYGSADPYGRVWRYDPRTRKTELVIEGDGVRLANPDNLLFDAKGRLLICEDQGNENLAKHGLNQVLRLEQLRPDGQLTEVLRLPAGAEPSGPSWLPGGKDLLLSVLAGDRSGLVVVQGLND